jgi:hypothetical protein
MTNETNLPSAILALVAAYEAERVVLHNRLVQMEDRLQTAERKIGFDLAEIERLADWNTKHSIQIANVQSEIAELADRVKGLHCRENLFDVHASKLMERVTDLEQTNQLRGEISGMDTDELEEIKERLDMLERAGDDVMDEEAVRELVDRMLERATVTISL